MSYSTQSDLLKGISEEELAELTAESGGTPEATMVSEAIAKADAEIDAYCGMRYQVPFSPAPEMVRSLSVDMAIYHLFTRRSLEDKVRRQKYEDAVAFLKNVSKGLATLGATALPPAEVESAVAEISSSDRVFSRDTLKNW
ncbi:MAG: DUF1320 domain-containing protein [Deltaproteobacteria bacterium]|nr:MAG: DUF1320 domain-containing protein [Deltaproteobacteria bacterium]